MLRGGLLDSSFRAKSLRGRDWEESASVKLQKDRWSCLYYTVFLHICRKEVYHKLPGGWDLWRRVRVHNSCFCSILSGIILGYVEKCFRNRGLPFSFLLFSITGRKICRVSCRFAKLTRILMRATLVRCTTRWYINGIASALSLGTRIGKVALTYKLHKFSTRDLYKVQKMFFSFFFPKRREVKKLFDVTSIDEFGHHSHYSGLVRIKGCFM